MFPRNATVLGNYVANCGRVAFNLASGCTGSSPELGDGLQVIDNHSEHCDNATCWTVDGVNLARGSDTNENRNIDITGYCASIVNNTAHVYKQNVPFTKYQTVDGECILAQTEANSHALAHRWTGNDCSHPASASSLASGPIFFYKMVDVKGCEITGNTNDAGQFLGAVFDSTHDGWENNVCEGNSQPCKCGTGPCPAVRSPLGRDVLQCAANSESAVSGVTVLVNNSGGLNAVSVFGCTAATPSGAACAPGAPAAFECNITVQGGSSSYVNISLSPGSATAVTAVYFSTQPFSYHALASSPPVPLSIPTTNPVTVSVPYPAVGALLCDTSADCSDGAVCVSSPAPPRCGPAPSPSSAPPAPVPSPSPLPPAAGCPSLTSALWEQVSLGSGPLAAGHTADAYITFVSLPSPAGAFTFACEESHKPCPGGVQRLNGTGQLSTTGTSFTLTPSAGSGVGEITGVVNNTFGCRVLALLTGIPSPLQWQYYGPPPATPLNTNVTVATYLSGSAAGIFSATGVAILSPTFVLVSGNGAATFPGVTPILLLGATAASNGTLLLLRIPATSAGASASIESVIKVGDRLDHVRASGSGDAAIAGSFGVAVLRGLQATPVVAWHDPLEDVTPGSCGTCCSVDASVTCRVDIGDDGVVAASLAAATANNEWLWAAWDATGVRFLARAESAASLTSVFVDGASRSVGASWFYNSNTGKEPMVMPAMASYSYATLPPPLLYRAFPWDAHPYREPGPCDGNVADGRIETVRVGRDGTLLVGGRSDGGDSPYACGLRNVSRVVPFIQIDGFTQSSNMQSQAITQFLRVDAASGEVILAQTQVARLPTGGRGNTLLTLGAHSDESGALYLLQNSACCIPNMPNLTVNGQALNGWSDATVLQVLDASMSTRLTWTHFALAGSAGGSSPVDIDVRGGLVVFAMQANSNNVLVNAIAGTAADPAGVPAAYFVALPTATGRAE